MKAEEWRDKTFRLIQFINANPHIIAMNPGLDGIAGYLRDMQYDLAAEQARSELFAKLVRDVASALGLEDTDDRSTLGQRVAELRRKLEGECETCGGTGIMSVLDHVESPDAHEVYANEQCAECHGTGIGWIGEIMTKHDEAREYANLQESYADQATAQRDGAVAELAETRSKARLLREALSLAKSMILGGEKMSDTAKIMIDAALSETEDLEEPK